MAHNIDIENDAETYFHNHRMTFSGINAGEYLDKEDFIKYAKYIAAALQPKEAIEPIKQEQPQKVNRSEEAEIAIFYSKRALAHILLKENIDADIDHWLLRRNDIITNPDKYDSNLPEENIDWVTGYLSCLLANKNQSQEQPQEYLQKSEEEKRFIKAVEKFQSQEQPKPRYVVSGGLRPVDEVGGKGLEIHDQFEQAKQEAIESDAVEFGIWLLENYVEQVVGLDYSIRELYKLFKNKKG